MLKKIGKILISKVFLTLSAIVLLIVLSILFWIYSPLFAYNDIHIFGNSYIRAAVIFTFWLIIFLVFILKKLKAFIASINDKKRKQWQELKSDARDFLNKTKRNFAISLKDAGEMWKNRVKPKKIPLFMVIGSEGAGKSSFINYAGVEYPITDSLGSYKKHHLSTRNFSLYVSKNGALIDTEGSYFSQEESFNPQNTDELPEDNIEQNKDYLVKKIVWKSFLKFLNKERFHRKLNGIILVVDIQELLCKDEQDLQNDFRYSIKRISECENNLNVCMPIYIVFSKLDLIEGMGDFVQLYGESVVGKALGITIPKKSKISEIEIKAKFEEIINSFKFTLMSKNHLSRNIEDKAKTYLFLKQIENVFSVIISYTSKLNKENSSKNRSFLRGVYLTSAYQENVPINILMEAVCDKYSVKPPMAKPTGEIRKQTYFVLSLLKDLVFKDSGLSHQIFGNYWKKLSILGVALGIFGVTYLVCDYFIKQREYNVNTLNKSLSNVKIVINNIENGYQSANVGQKSGYIIGLRNILGDYPQLFGEQSYLDYVSLNLSYVGIKPAKALYLQGVDDILSTTVVVELENTLTAEKNVDNLIKALYMYKSLFERSYLNKELLKIWVKDNWPIFVKYGIAQKDMLTYIEDLTSDGVFPAVEANVKNIEIAQTKLLQASHAQRLYSLLSFSTYNKDANSFYSIKDAIGGSFDEVIDGSSGSYIVPISYTIYGVDNLLSNINAYIEDTAKIESWLLGDKRVIDAERSKITLSLDVIRLYLQEYQQKWQKVIENIQPKPFSSNEVGLNILNNLAKPNNPMKNLVEIVSKNTDLLDTSLLKHAANLGFPTAEIKNSFTTLSDAFSAYHDIAKQNSLLTKGIDVIGAKTGAKQENIKIMDKINADVHEIYKKIIDITSGATDSNEKILYALKKMEVAADPFVTLATDSALLPAELSSYYQKLNQYAWNLVELRAGIELNKAWGKEMYAPFMNEIAFLYPINSNSKDVLPLDKFKSFFGKQGTWNQFFNKYLNQVLIKRGDLYYIDPGYASKLNFSDEFLAVVSKLASISNGILDYNDNVNVNFSIRSMALAGDFGKISIGYDTNTMQYDQTFPSTLGFIAGNFKGNTKLSIQVFDYQGNQKFSQDYVGEWGWLQFLQWSKPMPGGINRVIFDNNSQLYFDFVVETGNDSVNRVGKVLNSLTLPQNILR